MNINSSLSHRSKEPENSILYVVGTPIGNLNDLSLRALNILKNVSLIACEDTRQTLKLLNRYEITNTLLSFNMHNSFEKIPSIIHVDGTCRIQTVNEKQNKNYYDLIKAFKEKTGLPIVFNTSFNLGGDPLVETLEDALHTLAKSDIEYLYLPEYKTLFTISN